MQVLLWKWFFSESWGWRRFLADSVIGTIHSFFRLLLLICWIALGVVLGDLLNRFCGIPKWLGTPLSITVVFLCAWAFFLLRLLVFFPFPPCRRGQCRNINAYTWVMGRVYGQEGWRTYRYWCKCGDEYVREGNRFKFVQPDGNRQTYMRLVGFRKWKEERASGEPLINDI